jgi:hypothetical protein
MDPGEPEGKGLDHMWREEIWITHKIPRAEKRNTAEDHKGKRVPLQEQGARQYRGWGEMDNAR